jgi:hypothetical protein
VIRRSLVSGDARAWAWALHMADTGKRRLPLREQNFILDAIATAQDAEREARASAIDRLTRRSLRRLRP